MLFTIWIRSQSFKSIKNFLISKKRTFLLVILSFIFSACSGPEFKKGDGGLLYKIVEDKNTPQIGEVAFVPVSYTEASESGKVFARTGKFDPRPAMIFARMPEFKGDFQDALQYLSEGDSAILKVNMDSIKLKRGYHPRSDSSKFMIYHVRVHKVINREGAVDPAYPDKIDQFKREQTLIDKNTEERKINNYLANSETKYLRSESGLFYPADLKAADNFSENMKVNFVFSSLDGKVFDTNRISRHTFQSF